MEQGIEERLRRTFPYKLLYSKDDFKYLGFHLNKNGYKKIDKGCLLEKIDSRINKLV